MKSTIKIALFLLGATACRNIKVGQEHEEEKHLVTITDEDSKSGQTVSGNIGSPIVLPDAGETGSEALALPNVPAKNHAAFAWRGFSHEWKRTVLGFRVPHRISKFHSYVNNEDHKIEGNDWLADATFTFAQSTGVDGNYMSPKGQFSAFYSPGIFTSRGNVRFQFTDNSTGDTYPRAITESRQTIGINLNKSSMAYDQLDNYVAFLRGFKLDSHCDDAKQPVAAPCNSNGMWPYKFQIDINSCTRKAGVLYCDVVVIIKRAWTPNLGGLPPFETKPFNDRLDFDLSVYYTVVGGNDNDFSFKYAQAVESNGEAHDDQPQSGNAAIDGKQGFATATTVMTGFGFEFSKLKSADKFNHLGRYIGSLDVQISDVSYSATSGRMTFTYVNQVWVPDTVFNTKVAYTTSPLLLQFNETGSTILKNASTSTTLCVNSNGAPFFSKWKKCGSGDKGPERSLNKVQIYTP